MKYSEKWGDSIEAAVQLALQDLKLTRDQVTVTVLEQPSKGFFGIGSKLAKVRVEEIVKETPKAEKKDVPAAKPAKAEARPERKAEPKPERKPEAKPEKKAEAKTEKPVLKAEAEKPETVENTAEKPSFDKKKRNRKKRNDKSREFKIEGVAEQVSTRPADLADAEEHPSKEFLEKLMKEMGLDVTVKVATNAESVYVDLDGKDTGTVIGKRGQTLDAVQYLTSLVVNKGEEEYIRVVVDAEGYRAKREATLEKLAYRLAEKAVKTGRSVRLEPMNPYERKVIHTTLQTVPSVTTRSEGNEPYRRVVIEPAKK